MNVNKKANIVFCRSSSSLSVAEIRGELVAEGDLDKTKTTRSTTDPTKRQVKPLSVIIYVNADNLIAM